MLLCSLEVKTEVENIEPERLCLVDLYWLFADFGIDVIRERYGLVDGEQFPPEIEDDPFDQALRRFDEDFEAVFTGLFGSWEEWSECFNSEGGVSRWWASFCKTDEYLDACQIITKFKLLLIENGLDPQKLDRSSLLERSRSYDQLLADIWLPADRHQAILSQPDGWLSLRLVGLTLPGNPEEEGGIS